MTPDQDLTPISTSQEPTGGAKRQESDVSMHHGLEKAFGGKSVPASGGTGTSDNGNKKDGAG